MEIEGAEESERQSLGENSLTQDVKSFTDEHEAFAASRVNHFVFFPTKETYYSTLDQHADTLEGDVKPPLVIVGNEGSGKSALLANWYSKRLEHKHRDEFLFQHFVGCSTPSLQLSETLHRLETALYKFFQLREMKVPDTEEELRWSLNRFLEAAAKKHSPARIVIIIDGVHRLKVENGPDGALHWLPTELPPGVRFIVSTVQYDRATRVHGNDALPHRTFIELNRRNCSMLPIEPLEDSTRRKVIDEFVRLNASMELSEDEYFKIKTCPATSQPMFLRSLLQALRLTSSLTSFSVESLLDVFLQCETAHELIDKSLNICCHAIFPDPTPAASSVENVQLSSVSHQHTNNRQSEILGKVLTMVYVSRNGLSLQEIWSLLNMASSTTATAKFIPLRLDDDIVQKLLIVLSDFTMVVNDMYSFTHELYREVVYSKYIGTKDSLIRWHNHLAKYFTQLPSCKRKIVALPYHLEEAGSWTRVKNCLTDIEMFHLWWTSEFKSDFIKFWASLTRSPSGNAPAANYSMSPMRKKTGISATIMNETAAAETDDNNDNKRPTYDIVDEYCKSLDEYKVLKEPTDENVADIVLEIADFLLEFAILGHEQSADVPSNVHPVIPSDDLESLGVPHIMNHEGRSELKYPAIYSKLSKKQPTDDPDQFGLDAPTKAIEDISECSAYFFTRWLWIHFPYIALGNCNNRYIDGINHAKKLKEQNESGKLAELTMADLIRPRTASSIPMMTETRETAKQAFDMSKTMQLDTSIHLPSLKFHKKVARSFRKIPAPQDPSMRDTAPMNEITHRMMMLQDDIQGYRDECDFLGQLKSTLNRKLYEMKGALIDLERTEEATHNFDQDLINIKKAEAESAIKKQSVQVLHQNLHRLVTMCERHPANFPSIIEELKSKVNQDNFLLDEIKRRLWEQKFEAQNHSIYFKQMKSLVERGKDMYSQLVDYRIEARKSIIHQGIEDERKVRAEQQYFEALKTGRSQKQTQLSSTRGRKILPNEATSTNVHRSWGETWQIICERTGITDPDIFFHRINNGKLLEEQMNALKKQSESRLESLKKEVGSVEKELEESRYTASVAGGQSMKEQQKNLTDAQNKSRRMKEKAEAAELLHQKVMAGLVHLGEMLGIQPRSDETSVVDLTHDIEAVIDTLLDEREKQMQQGQQPHGAAQTSIDSFSRSITGAINPNPETHHRSPELDFIFSKFENPTVRLPHVLPSKNQDGKIRGDDDEVDSNPEGTWDRSFVKAQSTKIVRMEIKRAAKQLKSEASPSKGRK